MLFVDVCWWLVVLRGEFCVPVLCCLVRVSRVSLLDDLPRALDKLRQYRDAVISIGIGECADLVPKRLVWNFCLAEFGAKRHAGVLISSRPDFLQVRVEKSGVTVGRRTWQRFDQVDVAVRAGLETGAVFRFALGAKHNGRRVY